MSKLPSLKTPDLLAEIVERMSGGEPLRQICRDERMPAWRTLYDWIQADPAFAAHIARAREQGFDAIAEEALRIVDAEPERIVTQTGEDRTEGRVDSGYVQWAKNRAEMRLKLLAKWSPKKYGDHLDVTSNGETLGLAETLAERRRRAKEDRE